MVVRNNVSFIYIFSLSHTRTYTHMSVKEKSSGSWKRWYLSEIFFTYWFNTNYNSELSVSMLKTVVYEARYFQLCKSSTSRCHILSVRKTNFRKWLRNRNVIYYLELDMSYLVGKSQFDIYTFHPDYLRYWDSFQDSASSQ